MPRRWGRHKGIAGIERCSLSSKDRCIWQMCRRGSLWSSHEWAQFTQGLLKKWSSEKCHQVKNFPDPLWPTSLGQPMLQRLDTTISKEMARPGRRGHHGRGGQVLKCRPAKMVMVIGLQQGKHSELDWVWSLKSYPRMDIFITKKRATYFFKVAGGKARGDPMNKSNGSMVDKSAVTWWRGPRCHVYSK